MTAQHDSTRSDGRSPCNTRLAMFGGPSLMAGCSAVLPPASDRYLRSCRYPTLVVVPSPDRRCRCFDPVIAATISSRSRLAVGKSPASRAEPHHVDAVGDLEYVRHVVADDDHAEAPLPAA